MQQRGFFYDDSPDEFYGNCENNGQNWSLCNDDENSQIIIKDSPLNFYDIIEEKEIQQIKTGQGLQQIYQIQMYYDHHSPISSEIEIPSNSFSKQQSQTNKNQQIQEEKQKRLEFSTSSVIKRKKIQKGSSTDTKNLSKHFSTETYNFLKTQINTHKLSQRQRLILEQYKKLQPSINNFKKLFQDPKINSLCRNFYESKFLVENILKSRKMEMKTKIIMIKFLQSLCSITYDKDLKSWKTKIKSDFQK